MEDSKEMIVQKENIEPLVKWGFDCPGCGAYDSVYEEPKDLKEHNCYNCQTKIIFKGEYEYSNKMV